VEAPKDLPLRATRGKEKAQQRRVLLGQMAATILKGERLLLTTLAVGALAKIPIAEETLVEDHEA